MNPEEDREGDELAEQLADVNIDDVPMGDVPVGDVSVGDVPIDDDLSIVLELDDYYTALVTYNWKARLPVTKMDADHDSDESDSDEEDMDVVIVMPEREEAEIAKGIVRRARVPLVDSRPMRTSDERLGPIDWDPVYSAEMIGQRPEVVAVSLTDPNVPQAPQWTIRINPIPREIRIADRYDIYRFNPAVNDIDDLYYPAAQIVDTSIWTTAAYARSTANGVICLTEEQYFDDTYPRIEGKLPPVGSKYGKRLFPVLALFAYEGWEMMADEHRIGNVYGYGNYLTMNINYDSQIGYSSWTNTLRCAYTEYGDGGPIIRFTEETDQVFDIENPNFPFAGIYIGGAYPISGRLAWNLPLEPDDHEIEGTFRFDVDYQKFSERVGYLCSKGSLLYVSEMGTRSQTNSVLTDYTFAIADGLSRYQMLAPNQTNAAQLPFAFHTVDDILSRLPLTPKIVVLWEGLSFMRVLPNLLHIPVNPLHRVTSLAICDLIDSHPMLIDWYTLQRDLSMTRPHSARQIQAVMHYRDIHDCLACHTPGRDVLFSLTSHAFSSRYEGGPMLTEYWNVFVLIAGRPEDGHYYLAERLEMNYAVESGNVCRELGRRRVGNPLRANTVDEPYRNAVLQLQQRGPPTSDAAVALFIGRMGASRMSEFQNPGVYTEYRFNFVVRNLRFA